MNHIGKIILNPWNTIGTAEVSYWLNFLPHNPDFLTTLRKKSFENIVRKGENAGYQHFLLFLLCFLPCGVLRVFLLYRIGPLPFSMHGGESRDTTTTTMTDI